MDIYPNLLMSLTSYLSLNGGSVVKIGLHVGKKRSHVGKNKAHVGKINVDVGISLKPHDNSEKIKKYR